MVSFPSFVRRDETTEMHTYSCMALRTLFGVRSNPVARFTVIVTLLLPLLQPLAFDGFVPGLATLKTKRCTTSCADDHGHVTI